MPNGNNKPKPNKPKKGRGHNNGRSRRRYPTVKDVPEVQDNPNIPKFDRDILELVWPFGVGRGSISVSPTFSNRQRINSIILDLLDMPPTILP